MLNSEKKAVKNEKSRKKNICSQKITQPHSEILPEEIIEKSLEKMLIDKKIDKYHRAQANSDLDRQGIDFIITHKGTDIPLQVKGLFHEIKIYRHFTKYIHPMIFVDEILKAPEKNITKAIEDLIIRCRKENPKNKLIYRVKKNKIIVIVIEIIKVFDI